MKASAAKLESTLTSGKLRLALFHERLPSLLRVRALADFGLELDLATELRGIARVFALFEQLPRRDQRAGRSFGETLRQFPRLLDNALVINDLPHQSPLLRAFGGQRLIEQHQVERTLAADQPRQQPGRPEIGHEADAAEHLDEACRT